MYKPHIHMEYYSALKRTETATCHNMGESCQDVMPSKISQSQKDNYCLIPLNEVPRAVKFTATEIGY